MSTQDSTQAGTFIAASLHESEDRFRSLFETMAQGVVYQNAQGEIIAANPAAQRILGLTLEQLQGRTSIDPRWHALHEDGSAFPGETHPAMAALRTGQPINNVLINIFVEADGRHHWLNINAIPLFRPGDTVPYQVYTTFEDITDRKQAEEAVRSRERQLQALVSSLDDIVFEVDAQGTYVDVWTADRSTLFRPREEVIGKRFDEVFGAEASRPFFEYLARTLAGDTPQTLEYSLEIAGVEHWYAARYNPIHPQEPASTTASPTVSIVVHDITARKQAEALVYAQRDLARCIGAFDTVEAGFGAMLEIMLRLTGMDSGGIYLFAPGARSLDLVYHQGLGAEFIAAAASYSTDSPNVQMLLTGKPFYFPRGHPLTQSPRYLAEQLRSAAAIPILYQDRVIGCFNLASHTRDEVGQFARHALEPLAVEVGNFVVHLQAQAALHTSEEKFRQLADTINEVFWIFDNEQQRLIYLNPAFEKIWGISIEDTYRHNRKYIDAIHPDDRPILFAALARQAQGEQTEMEYRVVRPDGSVRWIFDRSFPILGGDGRLRRTAGVATDITALKHVQQELQELNRALETRVAQRTAEVQDLYDNAPTGYHSLDANGCFLQVNQTELNWLGYTREELIGRSVAEVATAASQAVYREMFPILKQRGWVRDLEFDMLRKDGSTLPLLVNAVAVYDEQGSFVASRATLVDNTERKRADLALRASEETLRLANAELARALRMKDEFLANMSHELRTPLHGILAMGETLLDQVAGPLNERQQKSVRLIETSGRHLLALINDLLDLSKIEAGKLELHHAAVLVDDMCRASLLFVRELAAKKEIQVDYANALPGVQISADEQRLKQMLVNLLSNAVKFTPERGHVRLSIAVDQGAGLIHFAVQDDGPGIALADQARLFQPFIQIDARLSREHEGTGLGLALVKRLAEQHGGTVQLDSTGIPGEGCRFTITLPAVRSTTID